jgi:hypothetical protein
VERDVDTGGLDLRCLAACVLGAALAMAFAPKAQAGEDVSFLSELRLGVFDQSIDGSTSEAGVAVNAEALFDPLPIASGYPALDRVLTPRPHIGATVNAGGDTSLAYAGLSWTIPLYQDWLFAELSFGGALHNGPLDEPGIASYGCGWAFRETLSFGMSLSQDWHVLASFEHMSNADFCDRNRGLTNAGVRLGYSLD